MTTSWHHTNGNITNLVMHKSPAGNHFYFSATLKDQVSFVRTHSIFRSTCCKGLSWTVTLTCWPIGCADSVTTLCQQHPVTKQMQTGTNMNIWRSIILSFFQHFSLNARPAELNARNSLNSRNFSLTQAKFCQNFVNFSKVKDKPIKHEQITYQQAKQAGKPGGKK